MSFKSQNNNKSVGSVTNAASGKTIGYSANYTNGEVSKGNIIASGGAEFEYDNYKLHVFTSTDYFTVTSAPSLSSLQFIIIGGGGNTSYPVAPGGGGAGGYVTGTTSAGQVGLGSHLITIGGGGGNSYVFAPGAIPGPGSRSPSSANDITTIALAGGGAPGSPGGSGSGGNGFGSPSGGSGTPGQGNSGGPGYDSGPPNYFRNGGGGGGAGGTGYPGVRTSPTIPATLSYGGVGKAGFDGWAGIPPSYGTPGPTAGRWFAGGGASAGSFTSDTGVGGAGGGGSAPAGNGQTNTGGGAAGSNGTVTGGSGIVMIRYSTIADYNYPTLSPA